nr:hypothetical protein [Tanacetum cinerariifolium]
MVAIDGVGFDWSYMAEDEVPTNMALMAFSDSKDRVSDKKDCSVESPVVVEKKTVVPTIAKVEVVRPKQQEIPVRKTVRVIHNRCKKIQDMLTVDALGT